MTSAQQPTMADVFMDRFRQGGQDRMAAQKMQSDMATNQAWKDAQKQKMLDDAKDAVLKRKLDFFTNLGERLNPEEYDLYHGLAKEVGVNPDLVPKQQFRDVETTIPGIQPGPASPSNTSIYGSGTFDDSEATPDQIVKSREAIPGTGYGSGLKYKYDSLAQKDLWARLMSDAKMKKMAQDELKLQSPIGKLLQDISKINGTPIEIPTDVADQATFKTTFVPNPLAKENQGERLAPGVGPGINFNRNRQQQAPSDPTQVPPPQQTPPAQQRRSVAPPVAPPGTPNQGGGYFDDMTLPPPPSNLSPKGRKIYADVDGGLQNSKKDLKSLTNLIDSIAGNGNLEKVLGAENAINRNGIGASLLGNKPAFDVWSQVKRLINSGALQELINLKNNGGALGQVSNEEGRRLESKFAALDPDMSYPAFKQELMRLKSEVAAAMQNIHRKAILTLSAGN